MTDLPLRPVIDAPVQRVYAAWTDPELLPPRLAPGDAVASPAVADVAVGGTFLIEMRGTSGQRAPQARGLAVSHSVRPLPVPTAILDVEPRKPSCLLRVRIHPSGGRMPCQLLRSPLWVLCFALCSAVTAQQRIEIPETGYCVFDGSTLTDHVYGFDSDQQARSALERVMRHTGLEANFVIQAANVPNAVAALRGSQRLILYNQAFMRRILDTTNTDWSLLSILAHEVGHHLQGHTLLDGGSRPTLELQADKYSGFVLQLMGASIDEAQAVTNTLPEAGSDTHPGRSARLAAVINGWTQAEDLLGSIQTEADPPSEDPVPQPSAPVQPATSPSPQSQLALRAVFMGDPIAYFVTASDDIVAVNPQTGQPVLVGRKIPPTVPGFVWMYSTNYITYGVTTDGRVMSRDALGRPYQVGYVTRP